MKKPLNAYIFNDILTKIESGYFKPGDFLPTEQQMEKIYGTSRAPIRQALGKLEVKGFISRKAGVGTIVCEKKIEGPWTSMFGFADHLMKYGNNTNCITLDVKEIPATQKVAKYLRIQEGEQIIHTKRIRYFNNKPIFYLKHYLPNGTVKAIKDHGNFETMRTILTDTLHLDLSHVSEELSTIKATSKIAKQLMIEENEPVMKIKRISYTAEYLPIEFLEYYVNTEEWKFRVSFSKEKTNAE